MRLSDLWTFSIYNPTLNSIFDAILVIVIVYVIFLYLDYIKKNNNHKASLIIFLIYFVVHILAMFDYMYMLFAFFYFIALIVVFIISLIIELVRKHKRIDIEKPKTLKNNIVTGILAFFVLLLGVMLLNRHALYDDIINYQIERENKESERKKEKIQNKIDKLIKDEKYEELIEYCKENNRKDDLEKAYELLCNKFIREEKYEDAYNVYYDSVIVNKEASFKIDGAFPIEQRIKYIKEGDSIFFGGIGMTKYCLYVGKFPIRWYFLKKEGSRKYLVSKYILLPKEFDETGNTNFDESTLKRFLNKYFYENVFSDIEKDKMCVNDSGDMVSLSSEDDLIDKDWEFQSTGYALQGGIPYVFWITGKDVASGENIAKIYNSKNKSVSLEDAKNFNVGVVPVICLK